MSKQQKYRTRIQAILDQQPQIKLHQLIYRLHYEVIPTSNIMKKLEQIDQNDKYQDEHTNPSNYQYKFKYIKAKQMQISEICQVMQQFQDMYENMKEKQEFNQSPVIADIKQTVSMELGEEYQPFKLNQQLVNQFQQNSQKFSKKPQQKNVFHQDDQQQQFINKNQQNLNNKNLKVKQKKQHKIYTEIKQDKQQKTYSSKQKKRYDSGKIKGKKDIETKLFEKDQIRGNVLLSPKKAKDQHSNINSATSKQNSSVSGQIKDKTENTKAKNNKNFNKKVLSKQKNNKSLIKKNQIQQDKESSYSQDALPNFQNQQQLDEFLKDQKQHKNLFDDKPFQFVQQHQIIKRSYSFYSKQFQAIRNKLKRYLIGAYHEYTLQAYNALDILDPAINQKKNLMDLKIYLKFYKDFDVKELLKVNQISKIFKKQAINHIWLDLDKFLLINYRAIERKTPQNVEQGTVDVLNQQQLIQRAKKFLSLFTKQRIKKYLKITNKQKMQKIIQEYTHKQQTPSQVQGNKVEIVDKFLKRNFNEQILKWYGKKQKDFQTIAKLKKKAQPSNSKQKRKEKSISENIQKLRSQSQKNINQLKGLLYFNIQEEQDQILNNRNEIRQNKQAYQQQNSIRSHSYKNQKSVSKNKLIHKNNNKIIPSAYKQLQGYNLDHLKSLKSDKNSLKQQLNISDDQPYLKAYFNKQLGLINDNNMKSISSPNNKKIKIHNKLLNPQKQSKQLPNLMKNMDKNVKSSKNLHQLPKINSRNNSIKKAASQAKLNHVKNYLKNKNEFINSPSKQAIQDQIRSKNNRSQPSNPKIPDYLKQNNRKRINSMKKVLNKNKSKNSILNIEQQIYNIPVFNNGLQNKNSKILLNQKQNQMINLKLYQFLQAKDQKLQANDPKRKKNNRNQKQSQLKRDINSLKNLKNQKSEVSQPLLKLKNANYQLPSSDRRFQNKNKIQQNNNIVKHISQNIKAQNINLIQNYKQQVYQLFKYFKIHDEKKEPIVSAQNQKRKGYLPDKQIKNNLKQVNKKLA